MLFYIIFTIFKGKFYNNQERYVKPKLDAKTATSTLKSLYHETLFLLQIMHSFPFYHYWTFLKDQAEYDANCSNNLFSQSDYALCRTAPGEAGWSCLSTRSHCCHPCSSASHSPLEGGVSQEALFSHPAFPHLCLSSPRILFKNNGSKAGLTTKPEDLSSDLSTHIMEGENWLLSTCTQTYAKLIDAMFSKQGTKTRNRKKKELWPQGQNVSQPSLCTKLIQ